MDEDKLACYASFQTKKSSESVLKITKISQFRCVPFEMTTAIEGSDATVSDSSFSVSLRLKSTIVRDLMIGLSKTLRPEKRSRRAIQ